MLNTNNNIQQQHMSDFYAATNAKAVFKRETITHTAIKEVQKQEKQEKVKDSERFFEESHKKLEEQRKFFKKVTEEANVRRAAQLKAYAKHVQDDLGSSIQAKQPTRDNRFYRIA